MPKKKKRIDKYGELGNLKENNVNENNLPDEAEEDDLEASVKDD